MTFRRGQGMSMEYEEIVSEYHIFHVHLSFPPFRSFVIDADVSLHLLVLLVKATDENLTSENWEMIMNLCDQSAGGRSE